MKEGFASDGFKLRPLGARCDYLHQLLFPLLEFIFLASHNRQLLLIPQSKASEN